MSISITQPVLDGKTRTSNFLSTTEPSNTYIIVSVFADRALTLVVNQAYDDLFFDKVDTINYSIPNQEFSFTIKRSGTKANFTLTNTSGEDCTFTRAFGSYREGSDAVFIDGGFLDTQDVTTHDKLDDITANTNGIGQIFDSVQNIDQILNAEKNDLVFSAGYASLSADGATLGADTNPPFTSHPTLSGWNFKNGATGGVSNLYFYSNPIAEGSVQRGPELQDLKNIFVKFRLNNLAGSSSVPFVNVYTRPTGSGDAGSFYKSRITFMPNFSFLTIAEELLMVFQKEEQDSDLNANVFRGLSRLGMTEIGRVGQALPTEELFLLAINTDSAASPNSVDVVYSSAGYTIDNRTVIIELSNYKEDKNVAIIDALLALGVKIDTLIESVTSAGSNGGSGTGDGNQPPPGPTAP